MEEAVDVLGKAEEADSMETAGGVECMATEKTNAERRLSGERREGRGEKRLDTQGPGEMPQVKAKVRIRKAKENTISGKATAREKG